MRSGGRCGAFATYGCADRQAAVNSQVAWVRDPLASWDELDPVEQQRIAAMLSGLAHAAQVATTRT